MSLFEDAQHQALGEEMSERWEDGKRGVAHDEVGTAHAKLPATPMPAISKPQIRLVLSPTAKTIGSSSMLPLCAIITIRLIQ